MTLQDNLDIYNKMIAKLRVDAFKKANKTITEIYLNQKFDEIMGKNKVKDHKNFNFYLIEFVPVEKKGVKNHRGY